MKSYFSLVSLGLVVAAVSGGTLLWDGSYYLYRILDTHAPYERYPGSISAILDWPILFATRFTNQVAILQIVFGLSYVLVPLLSLALSWWIVRDTAPSLFIWPVFGVGFGTLILQLQLVAESVLLLQLFWPIVLAILVRPRWYVYPVILLLAMAILFLHPLAILLFGIACIIAFIVGLRYPVERVEKWLTAIGFACMTMLAVIRYSPIQATLEAESITFNGLQASFALSIAGIPVLAFIAAYAAAGIVLTVPLVNQKFPPLWRLLLYVVEFASLLAAGALFSLWASDIRWWGGAITFRALSLIMSLPFICAAVVDRLFHEPAWFHNSESDWTHRIRTTQVVGILFALVLIIQSTSWVSLTDQLRGVLRQSPSTCISASSIPGSARTPLGHWTVTSFSLLIQGMTPKKVILVDDGCKTTDFTKGLPIAQWDLRDWVGGEFDMHLIAQQLVQSGQKP